MHSTIKRNKTLGISARARSARSCFTGSVPTGGESGFDREPRLLDGIVVDHAMFGESRGFAEELRRIVANVSPVGRTVAGDNRLGQNSR